MSDVYFAVNDLENKSQGQALYMPRSRTMLLRLTPFEADPLLVLGLNGMQC